MLLRCRDITEVVTDFVEGAMPWHEALLFRLHLLQCPNCRAYVKQLEITRRSLGRMPPVQLPKDVEEELRRRLKSWNLSPPSA